MPRKPWVLEFRIHGVHNTPPQSMLGIPASDLGQVAGDGITGVFRSKSGKLPLRDLNDGGVAVEAYSWGNLTSGVQGFLGWVKRVGWLALLPFALVNLAYWARPELASVGAQKTARFGAGAVRLSGALMTMLFVLSPLTLGVDLVGWQCYRGGAVGCPSLPDSVDLLSRPPFDDPMRRLVVGSLAAVLVIGLVWFLSYKSISRYEAVEPPAIAAPSGDPSKRGNVLRHPKMWSGEQRTKRLQGQHLVIAFCLVILYTGVPLLFGSYVDGVDMLPGGHASRGFLISLAVVDGLALVLGLLALVGVLIVHDDDLEAPENRVFPRLSPAVSRVGSRASLAIVLLGAHMAVLWFFDQPVDDNTHYLGENTWFVGVFLAITVAHVAMFTVGQLTRGRKAAALAAAFVAALLLAYASKFIDEHFWTVSFGSHRVDLVPDDSWRVAAPLVGAVLVGAAWWNVRQARRKNTHLAWGGAGASVLMAAAIWVALLFTTAIVTNVANYLNGDQSVADIGTQYDPVTTYGQAGAPYTAHGDVVIKDANVVDVDGSIAVYSGTVEVESFSRELADVDRFDAVLSTRTLEGATLLLPADANGTVTFDDSCLYVSVAAIHHGCSAQANDTPLDGTLAIVPSSAAQVSPGLTDPSTTSDSAQTWLTIGADKHPVTVKSTKPPQTFITLPQVLLWIPLGQLVLVLVGGVLAGVCWKTMRRKIGPAIHAQVGAEISPDEQDAVYRARMNAAFSHRAEWLMQLVGVPTSFISVGILVGALTGVAPWEVPHWDRPWIEHLATIALWVSFASSLGLIWVASQVRKSAGTRRAVGILWDLTTFWPRAASPFAPPCYAERVVPEMITRVTWALHEPKSDPGDDKDGSDPGDWGAANAVIVSAHSQGSAISVAALSRLSDAELKKVRLITYGSQIRAWYGRIFPAVFSQDAVGYELTCGAPMFVEAAPDDPLPRTVKAKPVPSDSLRARIQGGPQNEDPRWVNLFRRTDPIGFRVFSDHEEEPDRRTREVPPRSKGDPGPHLKGHSDYQHSREYRSAVAAWTDEKVFEDGGPARLQQPFFPES